MNLKYAVIIIVLILSSGIILPYAIADGCCMVSGTCLNLPSGQAQCNARDITLSNTQNCNAMSNYASQCLVEQCCCIQNSGPGNMLLPPLCTANGGNVIFNIPANTCTSPSFCSNVVNTYTITGTITNASNNVPIVATVSAGYTDTLSASNGFYTLTNIQASSFVTLSANNTDCTATLQIPNFNSNLANQNIALQCCTLNCPDDWSTVQCVNNKQFRTCTNTCNNNPVIQQQDCNQPPACDWSCTWTQCLPGYTQSNSTCVKTSADASGNWANCVGSPVRPPLTQTCGSGADCNHDGVLQNTEACDLNYNTGQFRSNCPAPFNTQMDCYVGTCQCKPGVVNPPDTCAADPGTITSQASGIEQQRAFALSWTLDKGGSDACKDYVDHFEIKRCTNISGQCNFNTILTPNPGKNARTLTDTTPVINQNTKYCYNITAFYNATTGFAHRSSIACVTSGDDQCMQPHPKNWCGLMTGITKVSPLKCSSASDNNGIVQNKVSLVNQQCTGSQYCAYDAANDAVCLDQGPCDKCNGVLGMFGMTGNTVQAKDSVTGDSYSFTCPSLANPFNNGCFIDFTKTAVDVAYNCSKVISCYDYSSQGACEQDLCSQFTTAGGCEWIPYNIEFNKGVCRPKQQALQDCTKCNDQLHNRFYPNCTSDTCALYGNCYFNNLNQCSNSNGVYCRTYNNQNDCMGSAPNARNVNVDTQWNGGARIGTTNQILSNSNDATGIGTCKWIGTGTTPCIKDADNNNTDDCISLRNKPEITQCERDNIAPTTTMNNRATYGLTMDLSTLNIVDNFNWPIGDDSSPILRNARNTTWLYYCITPQGTSCYPNKVLGMTSSSPTQYSIDMKKFNNINGLPITAANSNGYGFSMYYFAEDPAKNLETVKNFAFTLDTMAPAITLLPVYTTWQDGGIYKTNLTLSILLNAENSLPVTCSLTLKASASFDVETAAAYNSVLPTYDIPSAMNPQVIINGINGKLNTTYPGLTDGNYDYSVICTDAAQNTQTQTGTLHVEGDIRINDAYPQGQKFRLSQVPATMHINTIGDGTCRYSQTTNDYNSMTGNFAKTTVSANNYSFAASLPPLLDLNPSRIYRFYTACSLTLNGQQQIVPGDSGDTIYFSVDELPPVTTLWSMQGVGSSMNLVPYYGDPTQTVTDLTLNLSCSDNATSEIEQYYSPDGTLNYHDMSFGCNSTYYCIKRLSNPSGCDSPGSYNLSVQNLVFNYNGNDSPQRLLYGNSPTLCVYSVDNGGNIEGLHTINTGSGTAIAYGVCKRLNLRNPFTPPDINITNIK